MKKIIAIVLCLMLALSLVGCGTKSSGNGSPVEGGADIPNNSEVIDTEKTPVATTESNGTSYEINVLNEPPALTVIDDENNSIEALRGTYSWTYQNEDGTWTGITADSVHPLEAKEIMPPLALIPTSISSKDPLKAYLLWDINPDKVSVRCWNEECWGQPDAESEELEVVTLMIDSNIEIAPMATIQLKDGNYIYEIKAEWNSSESGFGQAFYSFYTVKQQKDMLAGREVS